MNVHGLECSLIGRDACIAAAPKVPRTHRLVLGDHSQVRIGS
jgi:glucose-1-phosphate thymidylyltransferase